MGDGILGNVNDGWFAQLAHGCENVGRFFGLGRVYDNMGVAAERHITQVNQDAINRALAQGQTPMQALQTANGMLERDYIHPQGIGDLGPLTSAGFSTMREGVSTTINPDGLGALMPLLVGAGVLGAGFLAANALGGSGETPRPSRRERALA
jgi:hypothetical protein